MRDFSPLFKDEDASDIAYNSLLGAGFVGFGIIGGVSVARTYMDIRKAGDAVDKVIKQVQTVKTEPVQTVKTQPATATPQGDRIAIHIDNIQAMPARRASIPDEYGKQADRASIQTIDDEINNGRTAATKLSVGDSQLGVAIFDTLSNFKSDQVAMKTTGALVASRAGILTTIERDLKENAASYYMPLHGDGVGTILEGKPALTIADRYKTAEEVTAKVKSYGHKQGQDWSPLEALNNPDIADARYITALEGVFNPKVAIGTKDIPYLEKGLEYLKTNTDKVDTIKLIDGSEMDKSGLLSYLTKLKGETAMELQEAAAVSTEAANAATRGDIANIVNVSPSYLDGTLNTENPSA